MAGDGAELQREPGGGADVSGRVRALRGVGAEGLAGLMLVQVRVRLRGIGRELGKRSMAHRSSRLLGINMD